MTNEQKLRELVNGISAFTTRKELMERITALISEGYVSKEAYNVIKEHYQSALAAKDVEKDYIDKYYYPKEFTKWVAKMIDIGDLWESQMEKGWILCSDPKYPRKRFRDMDELFNYWKENEQ